MRRIFKQGPLKVAIAAMLLVGVGATTLVAINLNGGDDSSNITGRKPQDDTDNSRDAEEVYAQPKGVGESSKDKDDKSDGATESKVKIGSATKSKKAGSGVKLINTGNEKGDSSGAIVDVNDESGIDARDADDENEQTQSTDIAAALEQLLEQTSWYDLTTVRDAYYWRDSCPNPDNVVTSRDGYMLGGYMCESVSYVADRAYDTYNIPIYWGDASNWAYMALNNGYQVDHTPAVGAIGQIGGSNNTYYGHVFWVERVNPDGSVVISEYNNAQATFLYYGVYRTRSFGVEVLPAETAAQYNYIHLSI